MATERMSYGIVNGPSREELFDALRLRSERGPLQPRTTEFTLAASLDGREEEAKLPFVVNGIVDTETADVDYILYLDGGQLGHLQAMYNVQRRRGRLERIASAENRVGALMVVIKKMADIVQKIPVSIVSPEAKALFQVSRLHEFAERIKRAKDETVLQKFLREL